MQDMSSSDMQICKLITPNNAPCSQIQECCCDGPCGKIKVNFNVHLYFTQVFKTDAVKALFIRAFIIA